MKVGPEKSKNSCIFIVIILLSIMLIIVVRSLKLQHFKIYLGYFIQYSNMSSWPRELSCSLGSLEDPSWYFHPKKCPFMGQAYITEGLTHPCQSALYCESTLCGPGRPMSWHKKQRNPHSSSRRFYKPATKVNPEPSKFMPCTSNNTSYVEIYKNKWSYRLIQQQVSGGLPNNCWIIN